MKIRKEILFVSIVVAGAILLGGLAMLLTGIIFKNEKGFTSFKDHNGFPKEPFRVEMVIMGEQAVVIKIEDIADMNALADIALSRVYVRGSKTPPSEENYAVYFRFYNENAKLWSIKLGAVKASNGYYYYPKNDKDFDELIQKYKPGLPAEPYPEQPEESDEEQ